MGNLLIALGQLASFAVSSLELLILLHVILSWLGARLPLNQLTRLFYAVVDAVCRPIRAAIPTQFGGFDFAPLIALAALFMVDRWLLGSIIRWGYQLAG